MRPAHRLFLLVIGAGFHSRSLPQASLDRAGRRRNLDGAFVSLRAPERVLLVDDVMTTGATADACARALRAAGALDVMVVTFARAGD